MSGPIAYHITFGTYGTRLHGDERGTVDRKRNRPGEDIIGCADQWHSHERNLLRFSPMALSRPQRILVESIASAICDKGGWTYHVAAGRVDHVHVLLTSDAEGKAVRRWFKTWLGQALSAQWPLPDGATWWSECGSVKWVWDAAYFDRVFNYVDEQRTSMIARDEVAE